MVRPRQSRSPRGSGSRSRQPGQSRVARLSSRLVSAALHRAVERVFQHFGGEHHLRAVAAATHSVYSKANILGAGVGVKHTRGASTDTLAVQVFVVQKLPRNKLEAALRVPERIRIDSEDIPTDVVETGEIVPMPAVGPSCGDVIHAQAVGHYTDRYRPVFCGSGIGHPQVTAGTLGCMVTKEEGLYLLSNNHVLAATNSAAVGDLIYQPGPLDGGSQKDAIAIIDSRADVVPLHFNLGAVNEVDAALALTNVDETIPEMQGGIALDDNQPADAYVGMEVQKVGRSTGHTMGTVIGLHARIRVNYENGRYAQFQNQIAIQRPDGLPFSQGGDSGALILSVRPCQPVGLLFAGGDLITFANPLRSVMDCLGGFEIVTRY